MAEDHAIAYLRGDLATSLPESYIVNEMKAISDGMFSSTAEVESAMREDFQSRTPREQAEMLGLLQQAGSEHFDWRMEALVGEMPDAPPEEQAPSHIREPGPPTQSERARLISPEGS